MSQLVPGARLIVETRLQTDAYEASETIILAVAEPFDEVGAIDLITAKLAEFFGRLEAEGKLQ